MKTPDFITRITLVTVAAMLLTLGCSKQMLESRSKTKSPRPVLIEPNVEVAKVRKGMSRKEVESTFGEPTRKTADESFYKGKGMSVRFDTNGIVFNVKCINGFKGVTKEDIGIGSTRDQLIAAYGVPDEDKSFQNGEDIWFAPISINFWVQRGKVTSFIVHF